MTTRSRVLTQRRGTRCPSVWLCVNKATHRVLIQAHSAVAATYAEAKGSSGQANTRMCSQANADRVTSTANQARRTRRRNACNHCHSPATKRNPLWKERQLIAGMSYQCGSERLQASATLTSRAEAALEYALICYCPSFPLNYPEGKGYHGRVVTLR